MTSILTLNCGLIRLNILGVPMFEPAPFIPERYQALPDALRSVDADVVALQEIYKKGHKRRLAASLADLYPHVAIPGRPLWPYLDCGLMVLSKFPLQPFGLRQFRGGTPEERYFTWRGWMNGCVETPDIGLMRLLNYHTTAGGLRRDPESPLQDKRRADQIDQILDDARVSPETDVQVLTGDLNAGPPASVSNYEQMLSAGFVDTYAPGGTRAGPDYNTWDSQQPLNAKGPHNFQKAQRIDHVFVRQSDVAKLEVGESDCVLTTPVVETAEGTVTISDHYGVLTTLGPKHE